MSVRVYSYWRRLVEGILLDEMIPVFIDATNFKAIFVCFE